MIGFRDPGDLEILRGDLSEILREAAHDVEYVYGDSITALDEDATGVHVTFERSPARRFDLVVGADGLHSGVRGIAFGPEEDFSLQLGLSVAVISAPNTLGLDRWEVACSTPGHTVAMYALNAASDATAQFFFPTPDPIPHRHDRAGQERVVRETFRRHGWEVPRLLAAMPDSAEFYFDSLTQIQLDSWSRGRVVLVGDAGYCPSPASGQGTGMALVGAYVLAQELVRADGDHVAAYARYEQRMRPYVDLNQKLGRDVVGKLVPASRIGAWFQRLMLRMMPYMPGKQAVIESIMKPIREASNAITVEPFGVAATPVRK